MGKILVLNHDRARITFGNPKDARAVPLLVLGSTDDRGNDQAVQPTAEVTSDQLAALRKLKAFRGFEQDGTISVAGAA